MNVRASLIEGLLRSGWQIEERPHTSASLMVLRHGGAMVLIRPGLLGGEPVGGFVTVGDLSNEALAEFTPFAEDAHIRAFIDANYPSEPT